MTDKVIKIPAEAKEIIKNKRTLKVYDSKADFDADVLILIPILLLMISDKI